MVKAKKLKSKAGAAAAAADVSPATPAPATTPSKKIKKKVKAKKKAAEVLPTTTEAPKQTKAPVSVAVTVPSTVPTVAPAVPAPAVPTVAPAVSTVAPTAQTVTPTAANGIKPVVNENKPMVVLRGPMVAVRNSGFIFFCNAATKSECFRHHVFALPKGRMDLVGRVKPGARLFLYDYSLRLLHGIYRAISSGGINLVPEAFGGNFPAQVKFCIEVDCIPLPESTFKKAIEENYNFSRFEPDLSAQQVHKLCTMFKPINAQPQLAPRQVTQGQNAPPPVHFHPQVESVRSVHPSSTLHGVDTRYGVSYGLAASAPQDPYRLGHPIRSLPTVDPRYGATPYRLPAPEGSHRSEHLAHVDPRYGAPYGPPALGENMSGHAAWGPHTTDSRYGATYGPPASNDPSESAGRYLQGAPLQEPYYHESRNAIAGFEREPLPPGRAYHSLARDYHSEGLDRAGFDVPPQQGYADPNRREYGESAQMTVSSRVNMESVPVSSRYSFSGAAYR